MNGRGKGEPSANWVCGREGGVSRGVSDAEAVLQLTPDGLFLGTTKLTHEKGGRTQERTLLRALNDTISTQNCNFHVDISYRDTKPNANVERLYYFSTTSCRGRLNDLCLLF